MQEADALLSDGVLAYRLLPDGTFEHYRDASRRRVDLWRQLAETEDRRVVAELDVRSFFPAIKVRMLKESLGDHTGWQVLARLLEWFENQIGYALPEGYSPSRSLANTALLAVDELLDAGTFTRWVDDYHVFCSDFADAVSTTNQISLQLNEIGFEVSREKTQVRRWSDFAREGALFSIANPEETPTSFELEPDLLKDAELDLTSRPIEQQLRYSLRLAAERHEDGILSALADIPPNRIPTSVMPRLAWAMATSSWSPGVVGLLEGLLTLDDEFSDWRAARLAACLWYAPRAVAKNGLAILHASSSDFPPLTLLSLRVACKHDLFGLFDATRLPAGPSRLRAMKLVETERSEPNGSLGRLGPPLKTYL